MFVISLGGDMDVDGGVPEDDAVIRELHRNGQSVQRFRFPQS